MTASSVEVTPGSGAKLSANSYTEGAVTVYSQNMILGEQYLPTYTIQLGAHSTATANSHLVEIMAGASLRVRIRRIELYQFALATTATVMQLDIFRLTTAGTGGGALVPAPLDPADAAAGATAMSLATVKGTEGTAIARQMPLFLQTIPASNTGFPPLAVWDFDRPRSKPLIIAAGATNGICLKNITAIAGATVTGTIWIEETTF